MSVPLDKDNEGSCDKVINIKKTVFKKDKEKNREFKFIIEQKPIWL